MNTPTRPCGHAHHDDCWCPSPIALDPDLLEMFLEWDCNPDGSHATCDHAAQAAALAERAA